MVGTPKNMSRIKRHIHRQFRSISGEGRPTVRDIVPLHSIAPTQHAIGVPLRSLCPMARIARVLWRGICARAVSPCTACALLFIASTMALLPSGARGQTPETYTSAAAPEALKAEVQQLLGKPPGASASSGVTRVDVQLGNLDPRLRLAPCRKIQPHLPPGAKLWGSTRVGLRCVDGPVRWNIYMPVTVHVFGPALVATRALPQGTVLSLTDLQTAEVDLAAETGPAFTQTGPAVGRILNQVLQPGEVSAPTPPAATQMVCRRRPRPNRGARRRLLGNAGRCGAFSRPGGSSCARAYR